MAAAGELLDLLQDGFAVKEELVADDGVRGEDYEPATRVDLRGVGIGGVGRADDLDPMLANAVLGRVLTDVVLGQQFLDERRELAGGPAFHLPRLRKRHAAQIANQLFGGFAELIRLSRHEEEMAALGRT